MNVQQTINFLKGQSPSRTLVSPVHLTWLVNHVRNLPSGTPHKMVECGVARGGCLALCSKANPNMTVIGLDSWQGMPPITEEDNKEKCQQWVGSKWGTAQDVYSTYSMIGADTKNLTLLEGWFEDTIPSNLDLFDDLDILRIDSDFYKSVKYCLEMLFDKVKPGGVVIFDDWNFNPEGVRSAAYEFLDQRNLEVNIIPHEQGRGPAYFVKPLS
mgnify:CR=1 FL=1